MTDKTLEQPEQKTLVINIHLTQGLATVLVAALLLITFAGFLSLNQKKAVASPFAAPESLATGASGLRQYYRTANTYATNQAVTACAAGYHFASIWELLDPSNLEYANDHPAAWVGGDMGEGPFTGGSGYGRYGWIRTGYGADTSGVAGQANCDNWNSVNPGHYGTLVSLSYQWGIVEDLQVWDTQVSQCDYQTGVWCVGD